MSLLYQPSSWMVPGSCSSMHKPTSHTKSDAQRWLSAHQTFPFHGSLHAPSTTRDSVESLPNLELPSDDQIMQCTEALMQKHSRIPYEKALHTLLMNLFTLKCHEQLGEQFVQRNGRLFSMGYTDKNVMAYWRKKQMRRMKGAIKKHHLAHSHLLMKDYNLEACHKLVKKVQATSSLEFFTVFATMCNSEEHKTRTTKAVNCHMTLNCQDTDNDVILDSDAMSDEGVTNKKRTTLLQFPNQTTVLVLRYFLRRQWSAYGETPVEWMEDHLPLHFDAWCQYIVKHKKFNLTYSQYMQQVLLKVSNVIPNECASESDQ